MAAIAVGVVPANFDAAVNSFFYTYASETNPSNGTGAIDTWKMWYDSLYGNATGVEVATFYVVSGTNLSTRDSESIGNVTAGSTQTFTGLSTDIVTGDYCGIYNTGTGKLEANETGGSGFLSAVGDRIPCTNVTFSHVAGYKMALYGTGTTGGATAGSKSNITRKMIAAGVM